MQEVSTRRCRAGSTTKAMVAKFDDEEDAVARERCSEASRPRPRSRPQGRLRHHRQRQQAREGYCRRRQGAAIAAARREAAEAKVKAEVLLEKMKTMEATLSRVATMLPSLKRLQRREDAAAMKIQAAVQGYAARQRVQAQEKSAALVQAYRVAATARCVWTPIFFMAFRNAIAAAAVDHWRENRIRGRVQQTVRYHMIWATRFMASGGGPVGIHVRSGQLGQWEDDVIRIIRCPFAMSYRWCPLKSNWHDPSRLEYRTYDNLLQDLPSVPVSFHCRTCHLEKQ